MSVTDEPASDIAARRRGAALYLCDSANGIIVVVVRARPLRPLRAGGCARAPGPPPPRRRAERPRLALAPAGLVKAALGE